MPTNRRTRAEVYERLATLEQRVTTLNTRVLDVGQDVKSLLETRTFTKGMVKAIVVAATTISTIVTALILFIRGH